MKPSTGCYSLRFREKAIRRGRRRGGPGALVVLVSILGLATEVVAQAQNLSDTQVALISADLADAAQLR